MATLPAEIKERDGTDIITGADIKNGYFNQELGYPFFLVGTWNWIGDEVEYSIDDVSIAKKNWIDIATHVRISPDRDNLVAPFRFAKGPHSLDAGDVIWDYDAQSWRFQSKADPFVKYSFLEPYELMHAYYWDLGEIRGFATSSADFVATKSTSDMKMIQVYETRDLTKTYLLDVTGYVVAKFYSGSEYSGSERSAWERDRQLLDSKHPDYVASDYIMAPFPRDRWNLGMGVSYDEYRRAIDAWSSGERDSISQYYDSNWIPLAWYPGYV